MNRKAGVFIHEGFDWKFCRANRRRVAGRGQVRGRTGCGGVRYIRRVSGRGPTIV